MLGQPEECCGWDVWVSLDRAINPRVQLTDVESPEAIRLNPFVATFQVIMPQVPQHKSIYYHRCHKKLINKEH